MRPSAVIARLGIVLLTANAGVMLAGCGGSNHSPTAPAPVTTTSPTIALASFVIGGADAIFPGQNTAGIVSLSAPAPTSETITLTSSDPTAVSLPSSATIAAGATSVTVPILTRSVASDTNVLITASFLGASQTAVLPVSAGSFFSFASASGDFIGQGRSRRLTPRDTGFSVSVSPTLSQISVLAGGWTLTMKVPSGSELRSGIYPGATEAAVATTTPGLEFDGYSRGCGQIAGLFIIDAVQYDSGSTPDRPALVNLHARFSQSCDNGPTLNGEVYLERP
jgi:hypothetical protein